MVDTIPGAYLLNNVQHKTQCLLNIGGATREMPLCLFKASSALGLTYQVLRVLEALPRVVDILLTPLHRAFPIGRPLGWGGD